MIRGDEALRAEVAQLRAKKGPQRYHLPDEKGFIPLHQCASFGLVVECQTLLEDGANIRQLDSLGHTPLHCAAAMGRAEIIKLLLDHKANIRALSVQGMSPLQSAQRFNRPEACEILRQAELREDFQRKLPELLEQKPPGVVLFNSVRLHLRCGLCDGNRLFCGLPQWKSIMGLKTECFECEGVVPMNSVFTHVVGDVEKVICVIAPTVSEPELLELLSSVGNFTPADALALSALPSASKYDIQHGQQLMDSIIRGDLEGLRSYFNGNNIDNVLYKGKTPLWYASFYGRADLVRWLLDQGAKVNAMSANFETPLHAAAFNRSSEVVMELVSRGAVVDAVDAKANTPLHNAIQSDRADAGVALMEAGANIVDLNAKLPERQWAVKYDQVLEIEGLLLAAFDRGDSFDPDYMIDTGFEFHDKSSTSPRGVTIVGRRVSWARLHELLDDLNGLLEQNPKDITRYIQRGDIFRRFNRLSESLVDYGVALRLSNHPLEALEAFNRAVALNK